MIKILLIAVFVVACNAQEKERVAADLSLAPVPILPVCYGLKAAPAEELDASLAVEKSSEPDLTEEEAAKLLGANDVATEVASKAKRSVEDNGAAEARTALSKASGSIILPKLPWIPNPCPPLLTTTSAGQELCPSYQQLYTRFWSSNGNGLCYVLFPKWQRVYQTRCKCKTCRNSCPYYIFYKPGSLRFRNYCKPRSRRTRYIWALCRTNNFFRFVRERITQYSGGCECRAYRTCY
ncbi:hypothetical protein LOTGIDRAFT_238764 [Lottia gigantea]|uniref:CTCK domain-containing protein n=1 Tax=Lottia gigantea TaxID=225164 RepID=V4B0L8_LOTGI|nr:hypothetical protein LOTGIDRAFT_238764 [Lottia gigantea]ESO99691.1 hypothetical protein LOTGIDRAFT_238764 [Lottia gigantea]